MFRIVLNSGIRCSEHNPANVREQKEYYIYLSIYCQIIVTLLQPYLKLLPLVLQLRM